MNYEWITQDMYNECLNSIVQEILGSERFNPVDELMDCVSGDIYEPIKEAFNDNVLDELSDNYPRVFEDVFFAQEHDAKPIMRMINKDGPEETLKILVNTHWFPGEHEVLKKDPSGPHDRKARLWIDLQTDQEAILSWDERLPYVGLVVTERQNLADLSRARVQQ